MAKKRASENLFPVIRLLYEDDTPATPPAGQGQLVAGVDKLLRWIDDAGVLHDLTASSGIPATIVDAKGDILAASAADTVARLAVGTDGHVLTADAAQSLGIKWAAIGTPAFHGAKVYHSADVTKGTGSFAVLAFDSETFDTDAYHDTVTNNSRLTIPAGLGGYYEVGAAVKWAANATGARYLQIHKNGSVVHEVTSGGISGEELRQSTTTVLALAATDYVQVIAAQGSGGNLTLEGSSTLGGFPTLWCARLGS